MVFRHRQLITADGHKECTKCHEWKFLSEFVDDPRTTSGKTGRCKSCIYTSNNLRYHTDPVFKAKATQQRKKSMLKVRYGITEQDVTNLKLLQDYKCAVCLEDISNRFHIDHDHVTGKVRGLLCHLCNVGLGSFRDTTEFLESAIAYLRKYRE